MDEAFYPWMSQYQRAQASMFLAWMQTHAYGDEIAYQENLNSLLSVLGLGQPFDAGNILDIDTQN